MIVTSERFAHLLECRKCGEICRAAAKGARWRFKKNHRKTCWGEKDAGTG